MADTPKSREELVEWLQHHLQSYAMYFELPSAGGTFLEMLEETGVRLVPAEPTEEMRNAFYRGQVVGRKAYLTMLSASPFSPDDKP